MTLEEMKARKREKGYSYAQISELSGIPLGTVQKVFNGETKSPRYSTLQALEEVFEGVSQHRKGVSEEALYQVNRQGKYTIKDYRALPDEHRVELIDGVFYDMAAPAVIHQRVAGEVYRQIANGIIENNGGCLAMVAPVDVQLDGDKKTMIQPDVLIVCDSNRVKEWGILGAPDFVMEVLSPATRRKDCAKKLNKYMDAGVREYWIFDPEQRTLLVYFFEGKVYPQIYSLERTVPIAIYEGKVGIDFSHILEWLDA